MYPVFWFDGRITKLKTKYCQEVEIKFHESANSPNVSKRQKIAS